MPKCDLCAQHALDGEAIALEDGQPIGREATSDRLERTRREAKYRVLSGRHRGKTLCAACMLIAHPAGGVQVEDL